MIKIDRFITLLAAVVVSTGCPTSFVPIVDDLVVNPDAGTAAMPADAASAGSADSGVSNPADTGVSNPADTGVSNPADTGVSNPADTGVALVDPKRLELEILGSSASIAVVSPGNIQCSGQCQLDFENGTLVTINLMVATGAELVRWTGDCSGNGNPCQIRMDRPRSVTAELEAVQKTLSVEIDGAGQGRIFSMPSGLNCTADCSADFDFGSMITLQPAAELGSTFAGWGGACSGTGNCTVDLSTDVNVTAQFDVQQVSLTTMVMGDGRISSMPAGIDCGNDCTETYDWGTRVTLRQTAGMNYTFASWGGDCSGNTDCVITLNGDKAVSALFTDAPVDLTVNILGNGDGQVTSDPMGIVCPGNCQTSFARNQMVQLTARPSIGSNIVGWTGACSGSGSTCDVNLAQAETVNIEFALDRHTVSVTRAGTSPDGGTISSMPSGISCGTVCAQDYNYGTTIVLRAQPRTGFEFTGWSGACSGTSPSCTITVDQDKNITANFSVTTHVLTVNRAGPNPTGGRIQSIPSTFIDCGGRCQSTFDYGETVELIMTTFPGHEFLGWTGDCASVGTNNICQLQMTADRTATGRFRILRYPLVVNLTGTQANDGVVTSAPSGINCPNDCEEEYDYNTQVTLTALGNNGANFAGWTGACSGSSNTCTVTMNQANTVSAQFDAPSFELSISTIGTGSGHILSSPAGIDCPGTCTASFPQGTTVTLLPTPDPSSGFSGWTSDCSGPGTCNVTMNAAQSVTGEFEDGLVAFYALNGDAVDNSRNGHDGVNNGAQSATGQDGISGSALGFSFGDSVEILSDPALSDFTEMTICGWFYTNNWVTSTTYIASKALLNSGTAADDSYVLYVGNNRRPQFYIATQRTTGDTDTETVVDGRNSSRVNRNTWYHFCGVYDGQDAIIYTNGSFGDDGGLQGQVTQTTQNLRLGQCTSASQFNCNASSSPFSGRLDNIKLYGRALSATEVLREFNR